MMLDARSSVFWRLLPNGCHIYDARGRVIPHVVACDTTTGEVIRLQPSKTPLTVAVLFCTLSWRPDPRSEHLLFLGIPCLRAPSRWLYHGVLWKRHGFWPAPLRVVPVPNPVGDGAREQRAAIDAIEESIRPMLKRGEWLDAWRGINR